MSYTFPLDVRQLVESRLASGNYGSEDDVLRDALRALEEEDEDLTAVREALSEWHQGDQDIPLAEAFDRVRQSTKIEDSA